MFERAEDGRFLPGVVTNPTGRPRRNQALAAFITEKTIAHAEILDRIAQDEEQSVKDRISCIRLLWDFGHLKPERHVHVEGTVEHDISQNYLDAMKRLAQLARIERAEAREQNGATLKALKPSNVIDVDPDQADARKEAYADARREVKDRTRAAIE